MTPSESPIPPDAWNPARRVARALVSPIHRFLRIEAASGLLLLFSIAAALVWANSAYAEDYVRIWHVPIGIRIGDVSIERSLHYWINDGLMTVFFFVVGLEIRREIHEGELSGLRRALLPLVAALGGVLVPAAIFLALNAGRAGSGGWAVPMATDIAFAVGVLTLLGTRVPHALRVLLLGLAVIDDIVAIIVIAVFFSADFSVVGLFIALAGVVLVILLRAIGIRNPALYIVPGAIVWAGLGHGGVHPTLAGVILGLLTPVMPWFGPSGFKQTTEGHLLHLEENDRPQLLASLDEINRARREAVSPAEALVHRLHPWVAFLIMPLFALANAGVDLGGGDLAGDGAWLFAGVAIGLAVGKPIGIAGASLLASRVGIATRSGDVTARGLVLVGTVGGVGFTMSLFVAELAFVRGPQLATAKLAILAGSATAAVAGLLFGLVRFRRAVVE
jgi:Na+:H+ antiporter, NhaA family